MQNYTTTQGTSPLGLRIVGDNKYVKDQVEHLVDYFDYMEHEHIEQLRQDSE